MWDYEFARAIKSKPSNDFDRVWYKATYSDGDWLLLGGQLRFSGDAVRYCYQARRRALTNGLEAWALLDVKQNGILILDVIG